MCARYNALQSNQTLVTALPFAHADRDSSLHSFPSVSLSPHADRNSFRRSFVNDTMSLHTYRRLAFYHYGRTYHSSGLSHMSLFLHHVNNAHTGWPIVTSSFLQNSSQNIRFLEHRFVHS